MSMKSKWTKIIVARILEGILTTGAFVVGLWGAIKSKKLEEDLDKNFTDEDEEVDSEA